MSPHTADDNTNASKKNSAVEGEIKIDHSDHKKTEPVPSLPPEPEPKIEKVEAEPEAESPKPKPAHPHGKIEPLPKESPEREDPPQVEPKSEIVVPGGITATAMNPASYFKSKYRGRSLSQPVAHTYPNNIPQVPIAKNDSYPTSASQKPLLGNGAKKILIAAGAAGMVLFAVFGFIFGVYIPGKPENVYSSGMERTGKSIESIISKASSNNTFAKLRNSQATGLFEYTTSSDAISGEINAKFSESKFLISANATSKVPANASKKYSATIVGSSQAESNGTTIYFKSTGLGYLGLEDSVNTLRSNDGKWIVADSGSVKKLNRNYFSVLGGNLINIPVTSSSAALRDEPLTNEDIKEIVNVAADVSSQYVFTNSPETAVFTDEEYVGKEDTETGEAYRYKVTVSPDNFAAYCKELNSKIMETTAYKKLFSFDEVSLADDKTASETECENSKQLFNNDQMFEIWIDAKYKVLHKIRYTPNINEGSYYEAGQNYRGADKLEIFHNYESEVKNISKNVLYGINIKDGTSELKVDFSDASSGSQNSLALIMNSQPSEEDFGADPPADAINISDMASQSGGTLDSLLQTTLKPVQTGTQIY